VILAVAALTTLQPAAAQDDHQHAIDRARAAIADFEHNDAGMQAWFAKSAGYAVFPNVGKGGLGIGGAHGTGVLFEKGVAMGATELTQVTVGLQFGGQAFAEVIFFEDDIALGSFKKGNFEVSAQVSAVAVTLGAAATAGYEKGVAIFTMAKGGLMYEASVGGQKFDFDAWPQDAEQRTLQR
jgi:lipid-binding SYLF domain-containing protein